MIAPCKDCPDRHSGCWGSCDKYKAWIDARRAGAAEERKYSAADGFRRENIEKVKKTLRKK